MGQGNLNLTGIQWGGIMGYRVSAAVSAAETLYWLLVGSAWGLNRVISIVDL